MYDNLQQLMQANKISIKCVAGVLGIHEKSVRNKLQGKSDFSLLEARTIKNTLFPSYDFNYLFETSDIKELV